MNIRRLLVSILILPVAAAVPAAAEPVRIIAFGDSLTAGYQLPPEAAFPVQLERALRARGHEVTVVNAGVSGDTATGGLARLDWALGEEADAVILELGANDALRGVDPQRTEEALDGILQRLSERGIEVLVAGMRAPPNLGEDYAAAFDPMFARLAENYDALFYPFFLQGVAADASLNLGDGIHPTAEGVAVIVERILPLAEDLISRVRAKPASTRPPGQ